MIAFSNRNNFRYCLGEIPNRSLKLQEDLELINGKLKIFRNGKWEIITEGTKWTIPPNEVHTFKSVPDSDATVKFCITPAFGFEGFFKGYTNVNYNWKINFL